MSNKASCIREELHKKHFSYSTKEYPFKENLQDLFGVELHSIHKTLGDYKLWDDVSFTQSTLAHKVYYSNFYNGFYSIYYKFIKNIVSKIVQIPFYFQQIPTFRLGLPEEKFVRSFHKDSDFNHLEYELNFNLGLSNYAEGNFFIETYPNSNQFTHMKCPYGEIFSIDHIGCKHGAKTNTSNKTMVSIDFRLAIDECYYLDQKEKKGNQTNFVIGQYFSSELINA